MKLEPTGNVTLDLEVLNVSPRGFWLLVDGKEHFLGFEDFPWFQSASIAQIFNVERVSGAHFSWPALDVDLDLESIEHPERFPLKSLAGAPQAGVRHLNPCLGNEIDGNALDRHSGNPTDLE